MGDTKVEKFVCGEIVFVFFYFFVPISTVCTVYCTVLSIAADFTVIVYKPEVRLTL